MPTATLKKLHEAPEKRLPTRGLEEAALRRLSDYGLISFLGADKEHEEEVLLTTLGCEWAATLHG